MLFRSKEEFQTSQYAQVDETPIRYLEPGKGRCGKGYMWVGHVPGRSVIFEWHASRAAECLNSLVGENYRGKIQCDGYLAYASFAKDKPGLKLFGCWAHSRRKFFEAQDEAPRQAGWILNQMSWLYHWEAQLRDSGASPTLRAAKRASHHRMVLERLRRALERLQPKHLPKSKMGEAIQYTKIGRAHV